MKKIFKFFTGTLKGILNNLDYVAAFVGGALAYKFAPMQLEAAYDAIITFDYVAAFELLKSGVLKLADLAVAAYDWVLGLFTEAPVAEVMEATEAKS